MKQRKSNNTALILLFFTLIIYGCRAKSQCIIKEIGHTILDSVGMYTIYSSDTCWQEMIGFADSLTIKYRDASKDNIYIFTYPETKGKVYIENSFAVNSSYSAYKIMEIQDTSLAGNPYYVKKFPEYYIKALQEEKKKK